MEAGAAHHLRRVRVARPALPSARGLQSFPYLGVVAVVLGVPTAVLLYYSFRNATFLSIEPGLTSHQYSAIIHSAVDRQLIAKSLAVGFGVATLCTSMAFAIAHAITFRFGRRTAAVALFIVIGVGISSLLVRIYAWGTILGTNGLINDALQRLGLIDHPLSFLFLGYFAIVLTMVYVYLPIAVLLIYSAMGGLDVRTAEASRDLGAGRWRTAFRVIAPQARAGILSAFLLVSILASSDYITPSLVGGTRGQMIGAVIRDTALGVGNYPEAAALAFCFVLALIATCLIAVAVWRLLRPARRRCLPSVERASQQLARRVPTFFSRVSFSKPFAVLALGYLIAPTLVVVLFSFNDANTVGLPLRGFTTSWYGHVVHQAGFGAALSNSIHVLLFALLVALLVGLPAAFALGRPSRRRWQTGLTWGGVYLPFIVPGVLFGTAVLTLVSQVGLSLGRTATSWVHVVLIAPILILVVQARVVSLDPHLVEAARDLHSTKFRAFRKITMPLVFPFVVAGAFLAAAFSLDELVVTTFSSGTDPTIPVWLFGQVRRGFNPGLNALGVMLMCGTLLFFTIAGVLVGRTLESRAPKEPI